MLLSASRPLTSLRRNNEYRVSGFSSVAGRRPLRIDLSAFPLAFGVHQPGIWDHGHVSSLPAWIASNPIC